MSDSEKPIKISLDTTPAGDSPAPSTAAPEEKERVGDADILNTSEEAEEEPAQEAGGKDADADADAAKDEVKAEHAAAVQAIEQLASEEDSVDISLTTIIGGDILATRWFKRQLAFLFLLAILSVVYITNRYAYQQEKIERQKLTQPLEARRKRAIVAECNLIDCCRRKNIEANLRDTTLRISNEPCYYLNLSGDSASLAE